MTQILVALIGTVGSIAAVALPLMWKAHGRRLDAIGEQVANNHTTNLRDDLDNIRDLVLDVRADMSWVRRDHIDVVRRVERLEKQ